MKIISGDRPGWSWDEEKLKHLSHETLWLLAKDVARGAWWPGVGEGDTSKCHELHSFPLIWG